MSLCELIYRLDSLMRERDRPGVEWYVVNSEITALNMKLGKLTGKNIQEFTNEEIDDNIADYILLVRKEQ